MISSFSSVGQNKDVDFSHKSFLVVDDFPGMRTILRDLLRSCGANADHIDVASNGKEAVKLLSSSRYDVVLCDFNLGAGKNGQQILEEAKTHHLVGPSCAWIMITAEKTADAVTGAVEFQPDAYLLKPITEAALGQRLAKIWVRKEAFSQIDKAMQKGDYQKAIDLCDERTKVDKPNAAELQRTKADLLMRIGEYSKARDVYNTMLAERDFPWAKTGLARVHIQFGELAEAKELLEKTLDETPAFLEAHDLLANTLQALGDIEAAARSLERAAKLSPNSVTRQNHLGEVSLKLGRLDNAEHAFKKCVHLGEHSVLKTPDAYLGLAKTCSAKNNTEEALKAIENLNNFFDDEKVRIKSMAVEGMVHHQSGNTAKAGEIAAQLAEKVSGQTELQGDTGLLDVARLMLATGAQERAVSILKDQVRLDPENAALLNDIKEIFALADMKDEGAALVESCRQEGMEMMNRGVLLAHEGRHEEAITFMREAQRAMPGNARVLFNLTYVIIARLQKIGVTNDLVEEARATLQAANQITPGQPRYAQLASALEYIESSL